MGGIHVLCFVVDKGLSERIATNHSLISGSPPDLEDPVVLSEIRKGTTVKSLCSNVSSELLRDFHYALIWGTSAKHAPQRCGLSHKLQDQDVVQIVSENGGNDILIETCSQPLYSYGTGR